jgi:membrane-associated protease RseP (regulator of RpoE activity)
MPKDIVLATVAAYVLISFVHPLTTLVCGRLLSLPLHEFQFLTGPAVFKRTVRGVRLAVGCFPISSYVTFDPATIDRLNLARQAALMLSGSVVLFCIAVGCRGLDLAVTSTVNGFQQFLAGSISLQEARRLLDGAGSYFVSKPYAVILGVVAAKSCAMDLLPIPPLGVGHLILNLFKRLFGNPKKLFDSALTVGFFVLLALIVSWYYSAWTWIRTAE